MAEVTAGLKKLSQRDLLPDGDYVFRIERIQITKDGDGEGAILKAIEAPEDELVGRSAYIYLLNTITGTSVGLSMVLRGLKLENVPDGEYGDCQTRNLEGLTFAAAVVTKPDKKGIIRNNVVPSYDADWLDEVMNRPDDAKPKKKTVRKKATKR